MTPTKYTLSSQMIRKRTAQKTEKVDNNYFHPGKHHRKYLWSQVTQCQERQSGESWFPSLQCYTEASHHTYLPHQDCGREDWVGNRFYLFWAYVSEDHIGNMDFHFYLAVMKCSFPISAERDQERSHEIKTFTIAYGKEALLPLVSVEDNWGEGTECSCFSTRLLAVEDPGNQNLNSYPEVTSRSPYLVNRDQLVIWIPTATWQ